MIGITWCLGLASVTFFGSEILIASLLSNISAILLKNLLAPCTAVAERGMFWGQRGLAFARGSCSLE